MIRESDLFCIQPKHLTGKDLILQSTTMFMHKYFRSILYDDSLDLGTLPPKRRRDEIQLGFYYDEGVYNNLEYFLNYYLGNPKRIKERPKLLYMYRSIDSPNIVHSIMFLGFTPIELTRSYRYIYLTGYGYQHSSHTMNKAAAEYFEDLDALYAKINIG